MEKVILLIAVFLAIVGAVFMAASMPHYQKVQEIGGRLHAISNRPAQLASEMITEISRERSIFYQMLSLGFASEMFAILLIMVIRMKPEANA